MYYVYIMSSLDVLKYYMNTYGLAYGGTIYIYNAIRKPWKTLWMLYISMLFTLYVDSSSTIYALCCGYGKYFG